MAPIPVPGDLAPRETRSDAQHQILKIWSELLGVQAAELSVGDSRRWGGGDLHGFERLQR
eukprot:9284865-Alexandrium_andersonii.AAC.1